MTTDELQTRLLRLPEVSRIVGLKRSPIYERIARGEFPKPVKLGPRCVAWPSTVIAAWVQSKIDAAKDEAAE